MPRVSLTAELNSAGKMVQKGPAPDYSMLLEMKRRSLMVADATANPKGRKAMGMVVDNMKTRGSTDGPIVPVYYARGAYLGFFKF
jgi:hypothetical protein